MKISQIEETQLSTLGRSLRAVTPYVHYDHYYIART